MTAGFAFVFLARPRCAAATDEETAFLIHAVETSSATFIRNGAAHTGTEAAAHMKRKAAYAAAHIHSPEDFIRLAGTKSELTGQPYLVKDGDAPPERCDEWLRRRLAARRKTPAAAGK